MSKEFITGNHLPPLGFLDTRFEFSQLFGREMNLVVTLTCENENVGPVRERRIVHDDRALNYGTCGDFHGQMIYQRCGHCTGRASHKSHFASSGPRFADGSYETHAWFSGFTPADNPEVAITVFLERGVGATNAAPLASKILEYYYTRDSQRVDAEDAPSEGLPPSGVTP